MKLFFCYFADSEVNEEANAADDNPETPTVQQEMKVENLDYNYYSDGTSQSDFGGKFVAYSDGIHLTLEYRRNK